MENVKNKYVDGAKNLLKVMQEHPEREVVFLYPEEGSDDAYTRGYPSEILVTDYITYNDRILIWEKGDGYETLKEDVTDVVWEEVYGNQEMTKEMEDEMYKEVDTRVAKMDWIPAIIVYLKC